MLSEKLNYPVLNPSDKLQLTAQRLIYKRAVALYNYLKKLHLSHYIEYGIL